VWFLASFIPNWLVLLSGCTHVSCKWAGDGIKIPTETTSVEGSVVTRDSGMYILDVWLLYWWFMKRTAIAINYELLSV
jgi:hypothetical protein